MHVIVVMRLLRKLRKLSMKIPMQLTPLTIVFIHFAVIFQLLDSQIGWHATLAEIIFCRSNHIICQVVTLLYRECCLF